LADFAPPSRSIKTLRRRSPIAASAQPLGRSMTPSPILSARLTSPDDDDVRYHAGR